LLACSANEEWGGYSYGYAFTLHAQHIYVRGMMSLVCLAGK